jgi:hypothetical protein
LVLFFRKEHLVQELDNHAYLRNRPLRSISTSLSRDKAIISSVVIALCRSSATPQSTAPLALRSRTNNVQAITIDLKSTSIYGSKPAFFRMEAGIVT